MRRVTTAVLLASLSATPSQGQSITAGTQGPGPAGFNCGMFLCSPDGVEVEQLYSSALFQDPFSIASLTFFLSSAPEGYTGGMPYTGQTFDIYLSTTAATVAGISRVFTDNIGADQTLFATVTLAGPTGPAGSELTIEGETPYSYFPANGNLLLNVFVHGALPNIPPGEQSFFAAAVNDPNMVRVFNLGGVPSPNGWTDAMLDEPSSTLVTRFNGVTATPEPATLGLFATGLLFLGGMIVARRRSRASIV